jgi:hypothetical protein
MMCVGERLDGERSENQACEKGSRHKKNEYRGEQGSEGGELHICRVYLSLEGTEGGLAALERVHLKNFVRKFFHIACLGNVLHAMRKVSREHFIFECRNCTLDCAGLSDDVYAVLVLIDHAVDSADLTFDPLEAR